MTYAFVGDGVQGSPYPCNTYAINIAGSFDNGFQDGALDGWTSTAMHEYAESVTDPVPPSGYVDSAGNEIGDKCSIAAAQERPNYVVPLGNLSVGGSRFDAVESLWSNADDACAFSVQSESTLYTLDGDGGVHAGSRSPALRSPDYLGSDIARSITLLPDGSGGYYLDGYGGVHPVGHVRALSASQVESFSSDIARGIILEPWATPTNPAGEVVDGYGGVHNVYVSDPNSVMQPESYYSGADIVRSMVAFPDSYVTAAGHYVLAGYTLRDDGSLVPAAALYGTYPPNESYTTPNFNGADLARGIVLSPGATSTRISGYEVDAYGGVHAWGGATAVGISTYWGTDVVRGFSQSLTPSSAGRYQGLASTSASGWIINAYGSTGTFGSPPSASSNCSFTYDIVRGAATAGQGSGSR